MNPEQPARIRELLTKNSTLTLATVNAQGRPESAPLFFAEDDGSLVWTSGLHTRHSQNLAANNWAAVTIYGQEWSWYDISGLQMEGEVDLIPAGPARDHAWELYKVKFPSALEFQDDISTTPFYRFTPHWIRVVDNREQFGFLEELNLA
jgi:uncharacterized protein YhbP (UPF0306 family)